MDTRVYVNEARSAEASTGERSEPALPRVRSQPRPLPRAKRAAFQLIFRSNWLMIEDD